MVAINLGPYQTVHALESALDNTKILYLVDGPAKVHRQTNNLPFFDLTDVISKWHSIDNFLRDSNITNIIRSCSETSGKLNLEVLASISANTLDIPVYVVEDFPGNYRKVHGEQIERLFIEQESLMDLHEERGVDRSIIRVSPNPRYQNMLAFNIEELHKQVVSKLGLGSQPHIMWAGQPDGTNSFRTLLRVLKHYKNREATILFRAHPQDTLYHSGYYESLFTTVDINIIDVSQYDNIVELYSVSDVVMTQFSSTAVEASHIGIPAIFVLFNDIGKPHLELLKGYDTIPYTQNECSFLIETKEDIQVTLDRAIYDQTLRDRVIDNFSREYGNLTNGLKCIIETLNV